MKIKERGLIAAERYLDSMSYEIICKNYKCDAGSIDFVAKDDNALVFIEVAVVGTSANGFPQERLTPAKRARLERVARRFLTGIKETDMGLRFDHIGIIALDEERMLIKHHVNALGVD